jgi:hypothetical protein
MSRHNAEPKTSSRVLRQFAGAWLFFFILLAARQYISRHNHAAGWILAGIGFIFGICGLVWPASVRWLYLVAMFVTRPIGWLVSRVALLILFFGVVTPLAFFFRMRGRDALQLHSEPEQTSYWKSKQSVADLRRYFRQY